MSSGIYHCTLLGTPSTISLKIADDTEDKTNKFTWVELEDGVKTEGDVNMTFTEKDGQLVGDVLMVKLYFEKK
jgi:hypothetical protein